MRKAIICSTSTGGLDYYDKEHNIEIVRIKLLIGDKEYLDGVDIKAEEFYMMLRNNKGPLPKTSQPSVGEMMEFYNGLYERGYTDVFLTTISAELSGTYNSAVQAAKELEDKMNIRVFDTKTVTFSEGMFALKAEEMLNEGKTFDQIEEVLTRMRKRNTIFFAVDSLEYLVKNGRLSGAAGFMGKMLKIKPILQVQETGKIVAIEKIRTIKKALSLITNKIEAYTNGRPYDAHIIYTGNPSLQDHFLEVLKEELGLENLYMAPSTPVVGGHVGPDVIGIGIFLKE